MMHFLSKYKGLILIVFLGLFISTIDNYVLSGQFKGIEEHKHFIYIGCLVLGLAVTLSILLKEDKPTE
ncbi:MAG: hypothetical protein ACPG7X_02470 [Flavobacteriaceae bacterium]